MPSTRSRTSTEAPELGTEEVKKDVEQQNEEVKETLDKAEESNDNTTSTTADEKDDEDSVDSEAKDANGDQSDSNEAKIENGSSKRKSDVGEGDAPDSSEITPKKARIEDADVEEDNSAEQVDGTA